MESCQSGTYIRCQVNHYHSETAGAAPHHYQYFEQSCCTLHNFTRGGLTVLSGIENAFLVIYAVKTPNHPVPATCHSGGSQRSENNNFDDQDMTDTKTKSSPGSLWNHLELLTLGICLGWETEIGRLHLCHCYSFLGFTKCNLDA